LEWDNVVKAYESDQYVVLSDENLKRMNMKATQTIDILTFVDARQVLLTAVKTAAGSASRKQCRRAVSRMVKRLP
jgi:non-homologous end joining protein Ku